MSERSSIKEFQQRLISWYAKEGRKFYWRNKKLTPWQWLVLELLLKRTRAETVEKFYPKFIKKYNNPQKVNQTTDEELEQDLKFLGLQRQRRTALKRITEKIIANHNGKVPLDYESLMSIPHVGRYITNAVLCFSQNQKRPIVDVNVARILTRFHGLEMPKDTREEWIWKLAKEMMPEKKWKKYNYSLLDFGAIVCTSKNPKCVKCIISRSCCLERKKHH